MRILLIEPDTENGDRHQSVDAGVAVATAATVVPTLRLALPLVAALAADYAEVDLAYDVRGDLEDIDMQAYDLVGVTCTRHRGQMARAEAIACDVRRCGVPVLVGGPVTIAEDHAHVPRLLDAFDCVVVGEAEPVMTSLLRDARGGRLRTQYRAEPMEKFERIPPPRFDLVDLDRFALPHVFPVQSARGCPRKCTFCSEFMFGAWRLRPVSEVIDELHAYKELYDAEFIVFRDDDFLVHPRRSQELLERMVPLGLEWTCQTDLHLTRHPHLVELAIEAGMRSVCFGLESVREENRRDIGKNYFTLDGASDLLHLLDERGVESQINIIFGLDHDTPDVFDETVDFLLRHRVSTFYANILNPEPGTALHTRLQAEGRLLNLPEPEPGEESADTINYVPKFLTPTELVRGTQAARDRFRLERARGQNYWLGSEKTEY